MKSKKQTKTKSRKVTLKKGRTKDMLPYGTIVPSGTMKTSGDMKAGDMKAEW